MRKNHLFDDMIIVSRRQVELAITIRQYRRMHNLSQGEMAHICSIYAQPYNVKFTQTEISNYENYRLPPSKTKFQILLNTMDVDNI